MTAETFSAAGRPFRTWAYTVSMSRLLLRSTKSPSFGSRIDVLFQNVKAMKLVKRLDGVTVRGPSEDERKSIETETGIPADANTRIYIVESSSYAGYVIAGVMAIDERDAEYDEPSALLEGA